MSEVELNRVKRYSVRSIDGLIKTIKSGRVKPTEDGTKEDEAIIAIASQFKKAIAKAKLDASGKVVFN